MRAKLAVVALASSLGLMACEVPTEPTPAVVTTSDADRLALLPRPRDSVTLTAGLGAPHPLFEDRFWRELIFNQRDEPGALADLRTRPFSRTSPNVYVWLANEGGERVVRPEWRNTIYREVPRLAEQLTGQPYRGRIEDGMVDRSRRGWITVRFTVPSRQWCGKADVGADPGSIWIAIDAPFQLREQGNCDDVLLHLIAHEFGHAMGLWHVSDPTAVMAVGKPNTPFNERERYHAQLLFRVGHGKRYCGWPFSPECERLNRGGSLTFLPRVVVE